MEQLIYTPTDFVAIANQTLEYTFGMAYIEGELANFRISKNKWVYFDIKDDTAKISCFASIYTLPGPLEDGMVIKIAGTPRLHPQFGFSVTAQAIQPSGEGSIKKAFELLRAKLVQEGLFDDSRKRFLPYPPCEIALVTSTESAAYADFMKILGARWPFVKITVYDTQVQGESAPSQLVQAIELANASGTMADVMVVTRGGGSADDLAAFNDERVVRAIAASRIPTLVAIGHEIDESLAELAADSRASTPSNAAELLTPDRQAELRLIKNLKQQFAQNLRNIVASERIAIDNHRLHISQSLIHIVRFAHEDLVSIRHILTAYNPTSILKRGYALLTADGAVIKNAKDVRISQILEIQIADAYIDSKILSIKKREQSND